MFNSANIDYIFVTSSVASITSSSFIGDPNTSWRGVWFSYSTMNVSLSTFYAFYIDSIGVTGAGLYSLSSNTYIDQSTF